MSTITLNHTFSAGATIIASEHNTNFSTIYNDYNGNITNANISGSASIAATKLNLASIAQDMAMSSSEFLFAKGSDVASGTSISLGTDGNFFDITGTTNIETITIKQAGTVVWLHFDGALTLVDNTGNLELRGNNITVAAEDIVGLVSDGTNWNIIDYNSLPTDLNITSQAQGDIIYFNGTNWVRLAKGTASQILAMNSGATAPEWVSSGMKLVASTSPSSAASYTGNMTLAADKTYLLTWALDMSANDALAIIFNDDISGSDYAHQVRELTFANPPVETTVGSGGVATGIRVNGTSGGGDGIYGHAFIHTTDNFGDNASVNGSSVMRTSTNRVSANFAGSYFGGAVTSVELYSGTASFTGEVRLYEIVA